MAKIKYPYTFDKNKRNIARGYTRTKIMSGIVNGIFIPIIFFIAFLYTGWSNIILEASMGISELLVIPIYTVIFISILSLVQLPIRFYFSYVYEHKHNLSRQTVAGWVKDFTKAKFLSYVFFVPAVTGVYYLMGLQNWWIIAGIIYIIIMAIMDYISPIIILPFFYKLKPYANKSHKKKILAICKKLGAGDIRNVLVANESEKSVKANAMFTGFGRTKRIVLFDTLLSTFTKAEIDTVIGHELGHYLNKDILKGFILDAILIFPTLYLVDMFLNTFSSGYGISPYMITSLPLFMLSFMLIDLALMPFTAWYSRRLEANADLFALDHIKNPIAQISTERRLADNSLQDDEPPKWVELLLFDHPTVKDRIKMAQNWKKK
jgi:STE24 endopeptidase